MVPTKKTQTQKNGEALANQLAKFSRGLTRAEIISTLSLEDRGQATIWRWLTAAKQSGLVEMEGTGSQSRWIASEDLRRSMCRELISRPLSKRPMSTYNELWLKDYVPNVTHYLSKKERSKLHRRSPPGCAPLSKLDQHDMSKFLCGLPFGSSALEGNSYSMLDTVQLIEAGLFKEGASPKETQMILNHHDAVRYLIDNIHSPPQKGDVGVSVSEIRTLHSLLSNGLLSDPAMSGRARNSHVSIADCSYTPLDIREALEGCMSQIMKTCAKIEDPYEQAFFLVVHISYLQPFIDCNKRTSRVACNIPLLRAGVVPMSWVGVEMQPMRDALLGVYELNDTSMMSEVFVDGYLRSIESFHIMTHSREPDEVSIKYHREVRQFVKDLVLSGSEDLPPNISPEDKSLFVASVERELQALRSGDEGALIRNKLKEGDVRLWLKTESKSERQTG